MKMLKIISCDDNRKWYSNLIGQLVPLLSEEHGHYEYRSREPAGYINFVSKSDAEVVEE